MFIVIPYPMRNRHDMLADGVYIMNIPSKLRPTQSYTTLELAEEAAQKLAADHPGMNIAVMGVASAIEAQKAEVTFVRKVVNKSGELVPEDRK